MDWKLYDSRKPVPDIHSMRDLSKYLQSLRIVDPNNSNSEPALPNVRKIIMYYFNFNNYLFIEFSKF